MSQVDVVQKEKDWHNKRFKDGGDTRKNNKFLQYAYKSTQFAANRFNNAQRVENAKVLDIGCGRGTSRANQFCARGCTYLGVDISEECIIANTNEAKDLGIKASFVCDDANTLSSISGEKFDLIILSGTLHHLDIKKSLETFSNLISPDGRLLMWEPMGENPIINLFRALTPSVRTEDEHPLTFRDLDYIKTIFPDTKIELHTLLSLLNMAPCLLADLVKSPRIADASINLLGKLDMRLGKVPAVRRLHWITIINSGFNNIS